MLTTSCGLEATISNLLIGTSSAIQTLRSDILAIADTDLPVLIQGETGTGKELVAQAIHLASARPGRFVALNVCAISESMFEDALFGHIRGAFTGAVSDSLGYLLEADRGTLFLDEISGLPLNAQVKLLRAVETREFRPVGARSDRRSDFRVVAASNQDVDDLIARERFRPDLAFRLRGIEITVPPLRQRPEDIRVLAEHFAALTAHETRRAVTLSAEVLRRLERGEWPGNVRELRQIVGRAIAFAKGWDVITVTNLNRAWPERAVASPPLREGCALNDDRDFSRRRLIEILDRHDWNTSAAAAELRVTRKTVYARLQRFGIGIPNRYRRRSAHAVVIHEIHRESRATAGESRESPATRHTQVTPPQSVTH
jgi:DNA-binding NtrC family response regulator